MFLQHTLLNTGTILHGTLHKCRQQQNPSYAVQQACVPAADNIKSDEPLSPDDRPHPSPWSDISPPQVSDATSSQPTALPDAVTDILLASQPEHASSYRTGVVPAAPSQVQAVVAGPVADVVAAPVAEVVAAPAAEVVLSGAAQSAAAQVAAPESRDSVVADGPSPTAVPTAAAGEEIPRWLKVNKFRDMAAALEWVQTDCYARNSQALLPFGVTTPADMLLLHSVQIAELPSIPLVYRNRLKAVLDNAISREEQVQVVFARHRDWLDKALGAADSGNELLCIILSCK